ncbi:ECF-type sigma factor [Candidatus Entotheonella palauensis]|uniref:ECF-type sigma factor n=1 Tax=Candidatus Entotheonella palauensis TaxID=93172 RepID=UPI000B7FCFA2|nr:ECF-type sigma factor [Candidatus Entotheonella palauensis]
MSEVTLLLEAIDRGDTLATDRLFPLVYDELRVLAAQRMAGELSGHTLQATALVHEAYLRLVGPRDGRDRHLRWQGRAHFFGAAAEAMRRILIDNARRKQRRKRGGHGAQDVRDIEVLSVTMGPFDVLELDEVLNRFTSQYPQKAELVKLRYFAGLGLSEAADVLGISRATANRHWAFAKAWLYRALCDNDEYRAESDATSCRAH